MRARAAKRFFVREGRSAACVCDGVHVRQRGERDFGLVWRVQKNWGVQGRESLAVEKDRRKCVVVIIIYML